FFIPALIGILEMWGLIKMHFLAWVALLTITALLVMAVSGWTKQLTDRIRRRK
ncbi:MAG: CidA/LrgA family protein, partial [Bacteroidales bacterium]|nr:CidA/LrgA family protein [Bacteroidales bacterium]